MTNSPSVWMHIVPFTFCFFSFFNDNVFFKIYLLYYLKYMVKHLDSYIPLNTVTPQGSAMPIALCLILFCTVPIYHRTQLESI